MELRPHYGARSLLRIEAGPDDPSVPLVGQRRRLADLLARLDADQWSAPSRCAGWSVQDVITHLVSTNQFWAFSVRGALAGEPTRFLDGFDPVVMPAQLVAAADGTDPAETLEQFVDTNEVFLSAVADIEDWEQLGEAPPGHLPLRAVVLHALWDSWVHERDVALPLGLPVIEADGEVLATLLYASALSPLFAVTMQGPRTGAIVVEPSDPSARFVVTVDDVVVVREGDASDDALRLAGPAVELAEALSRRAPLTAEVDHDDRWLVEGLATVFDQV